MDIEPLELKEKLDRKEECLLLDVREAWEFEQARIPGSVLATQEMVEEMINAGAFDRPIITICHHGVRSAAAATWLRARGFRQVRSLAGGVDRWAAEVAPAIGRY